MQLIAVVSVTESTRTNRVLVLTLVNGDVVVIVVALVIVIVTIVVSIVVTIDIIDIVLACRSEWNGRRWIGFLANPGLAPFLPFLPMSFVPPLPLPPSPTSSSSSSPATVAAVDSAPIDASHSIAGWRCSSQNAFV